MRKPHVADLTSFCNQLLFMLFARSNLCKIGLWHPEVHAGPLAADFNLFQFWFETNDFGLQRSFWWLAAK